MSWYRALWGSRRPTWPWPDTPPGSAPLDPPQHAPELLEDADAKATLRLGAAQPVRVEMHREGLLGPPEPVLRRAGTGARRLGEPQGLPGALQLRGQCGDAPGLVPGEGARDP